MVAPETFFNAKAVPGPGNIVPLVHPAGQAKVDFGEAMVMMPGGRASGGQKLWATHAMVPVDSITPNKVVVHTRRRALGAEPGALGGGPDGRQV